MRIGLSYAEAGKLGYIKSQETQQRLKEDRIQDYLKNPKRCSFCDSILSYDDRFKKFCNSSCAATLNNKYKIYIKKTKEVKCCKCENMIIVNIRSSRALCDNCKKVVRPVFTKKCKKCDSNFTTISKTKEVCDQCNRFNPEYKCLCCGKVIHYTNIFCTKKCQQEYQYQENINKWLSGEYNGIIGGYSTSKMIYRYVLERDGHKCSICKNEKWLRQPMPLTLDHIDGNGLNNRPENLRYVCPNCDRFLPTFGAKKRGKGRKGRKKYDKWKSKENFESSAIQDKSPLGGIADPAGLNPVAI